MMKKQIIGIGICMLFFLSALSATGITIAERPNESNTQITVSPQIEFDIDFSYFWWLIGADQKQLTSCGYGFGLADIFIMYAQSFQPTKKRLTAVALGMFKQNSAPPGATLTVSIKNDLYMQDIATKTINADRLTNQGGLILADFDDIQVVPEETYYIVVRGTEGLYWLFDQDDKYNRGHPWNGISFYGYNFWEPFTEYENFTGIDFLFITYFRKPLSTPQFQILNMPVINSILKNSLIFPIITKWMNH